MKNILNLFLFIGLCVSVQVNLLAMDEGIHIPEEVIKQLDIPIHLKAMLSSGDIVGNGGGLGEQNFRYVYRKLPSYIKKCVNSNLCPLSEEYKGYLKQMLPLIEKNLENKDALIFLSEKKYQGFFAEGENPQTRTAKTAFIKGSPIFINLDFVYGDGTFNTNMGTLEMAGILIHELGHQLGIKSHSMLDELSSQFRSAMSLDHAENGVVIFENELGMDIYNFKDDSQRAIIEFKLNSKQINIQGLIDEKLSCERGNVFGYRIINTHWERPSFSDSKNMFIDFEGWVEYLCMDDLGLLWDESKDLKMTFHFESFIRDSVTYLNVVSIKTDLLKLKE